MRLARTPVACEATGGVAWWRWRVRLGASDVRLGGQGWSEPDWNGVFYPRGLKTGARLGSYASTLDFVEIDSTFYASPPAATVRKWRDSVPPTFRFAAKVP